MGAKERARRLCYGKMREGWKQSLGGQEGGSCSQRFCILSLVYIWGWEENSEFCVKNINKSRGEEGG